MSEISQLQSRSINTTNEISSILPTTPNNQNDLVCVCVCYYHIAYVKRTFWYTEVSQGLFCFSLKTCFIWGKLERIMFKECSIAGVLSQYFPLGVEERLGSHREKWASKTKSLSNLKFENKTDCLVFLKVLSVIMGRNSLRGTKSKKCSWGWGCGWEHI